MYTQYPCTDGMIMMVLCFDHLPHCLVITLTSNNKLFPFKVNFYIYTLWAAQIVYDCGPIYLNVYMFCVICQLAANLQIGSLSADDIAPVLLNLEIVQRRYAILQLGATQSADSAGSRTCLICR